MSNLVDLKEVVFFQEGPGVRKWQFRNEGIKLLNVKNIVNGELDLSNTERYLDPKEVSSSYNHFLLEPNDIVMASSGVTWGKTAIVKKEYLPLCLNTSTIRFKSLDENILNRDYLLHFLNSRQFRDQIERLITGSAQPNFGPSHLTQVKLYLPPLPQQKRIAAILDKADAVRRKRQETFRLLDEFLRSVFLEMFGDPVRNEKGWEMKKLADLGDWASGGTPSRSNNSYFEGTIDWYTAGELNNRYLDGSKEKITEKAINESSAKLFKAGSLLIGMYDTAAFKMGILKKDSTCNQACANINPHISECNIDWLYSVLIAMRLFFLTQRRGIRQKNLNLGMIMDFEIPVPPLKYQTKFAEIVTQQEKQKHFLIESLTEMENGFNSLMQKAFRGEL